MRPAQLVHADCLNWTSKHPDDYVDLVIGSPPYESARTYDIAFNLTGQAWVDWALPRFIDQVRICRGLVCWVVEGQTRDFQWSATPVLLMAALHNAGIKVRKPPIYHRIGIPGSGGPDWWRNDYEFCVCASKGKLPWSDNVATGHPPKFGVGGAMSNRTKDGNRVNADAKRKTDFPKHYGLPEKANPGNVIKTCVGGGHLGSEMAHENEAPYPEKLVEPFVVSFCPPNGIVYDPFLGSGTTGVVARSHGRWFIGTDVRRSQIHLARRRIASVQLAMF